MRHETIGCAAALCVCGSMAGAQALPDARFYVRNNTNAVLTCSTSRNDGPWSAWLAWAPGQSWEPMASPDTSYRLRCRAPVRQVIYRLRAGDRYSLLRASGSREVRVARIALD